MISSAVLQHYARKKATKGITRRGKGQVISPNQDISVTAVPTKDMELTYLVEADLAGFVGGAGSFVSGVEATTTLVARDGITIERVEITLDRQNDQPNMRTISL